MATALTGGDGTLARSPATAPPMEEGAPIEATEATKAAAAAAATAATAATEATEAAGAVDRGHPPNTPGGPPAWAAAAVALADADPAGATALATRALAAAGAEDDQATRCVALRALGLAARETGDLDRAAGYLQEAVAAARAGGLASEAVRAITSLALVQLYRGETRQALEQTELAARAATGTALGTVLLQRALILYRLGRLTGAQDCYRRALRIFRRRGEAVWEARTLLNRAVLLTDLGLSSAAEDDLRRVTAISTALGHPGLAAKAAHNLGFLAARTGDFPRALALYDGVEEQFRALGIPLGRLQLDRCEVLLSVRLVPESRQLAEQAAAELAAAGHATESAEAQLLLSQAALMDNEPATALETAERARRTFRRQKRPGWLAQAQLAVARARWAEGDRSDRALEAARRARRQLDDVGLPVLALEAGLIAARVALEAGRRPVAVGELERASRAGAAGARPSSGRRRGTPNACCGCSRATGEGRGLLCGPDLPCSARPRPHWGRPSCAPNAAGHGEQLARLGLQLAIDAGRPGEVLAWAEEWRAEGLRTPPVRPPHDTPLAADLAELRRVTGELDEAAALGRPTAALLDRQAGLERVVARRARQAHGAAGRVAARRRPVDAVRQVLAGRALLELVQLHEALWSVVVNERQVRLRFLGPTARVVEELGNLRFALRRMVAARASDASREAAARSALHASERLDALLIGPCRREVGDRPLVIVPTGPLHALPWAALPHCRSRPFTVAPSAAVWERAERRPERPAGRTPGAASRPAPAVLVAGPGLPGATEEVADLAKLYGRARHLTGGLADAASVLTVLDGRATAHIAAHGTYRADSPLFSSLRLADGPLTVYDLEGLSRAPDLLVLSACDSGVSAVRPGDELMGLSSALLGLGTRAVVAGALIVPDRATRPLMVELHRRLRAGARPADALAAARAVTEGSALETPEAFAAAASFLCFGAG